MAIGTLVSGTVVYSGVGNVINAVCPTNISPGDGLVLIIGHKPTSGSPNTGSATTPTGWTKQVEHLYQGGYGVTAGLDVGNTSLWIFTKDAVDGSEDGTTISSTLTNTSAAYGVVVHIPTSAGLLTYGTATGQQASVPTSPLTVTMSANPGFTTGDLALWAMCIPTDIDTPNLFTNSAITATSATFNTGVELAEPDTTTNNDLGGLVAYATVSSGTAAAAPVITATLTGTLTNVRGPLGLLRVREGPPLVPGTTTLDHTSSSGAVSQTHILTASDATFAHEAASGRLPGGVDTHDLPTIRRKFKPEKFKDKEKRSKLVEDIRESMQTLVPKVPEQQTTKPTKASKAKQVDVLPTVDLDFSKVEQDLKIAEMQKQIDDDDSEILLLLM